MAKEDIIIKLETTKTVKSLILFCCALALAGVFSGVRTAVAHEGTMAKDVAEAADDIEANGICWRSS